MSRQRLHPSITDPSWLILRRRRALFTRWLERFPGKDLEVLDVGGRLQPYRELLQGRVKRYLALDLRATPAVDVVANACKIPFRDDSFDMCFCTQMLEYAPNPQAVIAEMRRVLKPGGALLLSLPSLAPCDASEDRWRFWPAAIRELLSGFSQIELVAEGSSATGFFRTLNVGLISLARFQALRTALRYTAVVLLNALGALLEGVSSGSNESFAVNYSAIARK
jgi:SAM-dependent methyltransferase